MVTECIRVSFRRFLAACPRPGNLAHQANASNSSFGRVESLSLAEPGLTWNCLLFPFGCLRAGSKAASATAVHKQAGQGQQPLHAHASTRKFTRKTGFSLRSCRLVSDEKTPWQGTTSLCFSWPTCNIVVPDEFCLCNQQQLLLVRNFH